MVHRLSAKFRAMLLFRDGGDRQIQQEGGWECAYRRCKLCGFTIHMIQRRISVAAQLAEIAETLEKMLRPSHLEW